MGKRLLIALTCIVMTVAFMPAFAFASTADQGSGTTPYHYVALGDASTAGFGMGEDVGYQKVTEGTYPAMIRDTLSANQFDVTVDQMGMGGMRTEELRFLLDDSYAGDAYLAETFQGLEQLKGDFRQNLADADLITYGLGAVDFGSFLIYIAGDVQNRCNDPAIKALVVSDIDNIKGSLQNAMNGEVAKINSTIRTAASAAGYNIDDLLAQYSGDYIEAAAYAYYSFCTAYDESIRLIKEQNPEADILVLGLRNMLGNISVNAVGANIQLGKLYQQQLIDKANAHMAANAGIYGFVDMSGVQTFLGEAAAYDGNPETISEQFKNYCDVLEDDFLLSTAVENLFSGKNYMASRKAGGRTAAYDVAAIALRSVANMTSVELSLDNITYARDNKDAISGMSKELMARILNKCLEIADLKAAQPVTVYTNKVKNWASGELYGTDANARPIAQIIMAVGIRSQMGDGFFQHPSALGHTQIKDAVLNAYAGKYIHFAQQEQTCTLDGIDEFWQNVVSGECYSDAGYSQVVNKADRVHKATGHTFGKTVVTVKPKFCKDGEGTHECSKCHEVETVVIAGLGPAKTKIINVTAGKKAFTVKWKKPSKANLKKTTGYEVRYSLKSSMAGAKTVTITKNKTLSKTVKKLKAKKKYYVQVRTYKTSGGKNYYSAWSAKKAIKTK